MRVSDHSIACRWLCWWHGTFCQACKPCDLAWLHNLVQSFSLQPAEERTVSLHQAQVYERLEVPFAHLLAALAQQPIYLNRASLQAGLEHAQVCSPLFVAFERRVCLSARAAELQAVGVADTCLQRCPCFSVCQSCNPALASVCSAAQRLS